MGSGVWDILCSVLGESKGARNRSARRNAVRAALRKTLRALLGALPVAVAQTSKKTIEVGKGKVDVHAAAARIAARISARLSRSAMTACRLRSAFDIVCAGNRA